jgi:hypothetical protein
MNGAMLLYLMHVLVDTLKQPGYYWTMGLLWTIEIRFLDSIKFMY